MDEQQGDREGAAPGGFCGCGLERRDHLGPIVRPDLAGDHDEQRAVNGARDRHGTRDWRRHDCLRNAGAGDGRTPRSCA